MSVDETIAAAKQGDSQAMHDLISTHFTIVERFAFQIGVSANDIEDVTQEVFIRVFRFIDKYTGKTFTTWLYKITLNVARDHFKKMKRDKDRLGKLIRQPFTYTAEFERDFFQSEQDSRLHIHVQNLKEKYKIPLVLFYFHEKKLSEISDIMGIPLSTVKTRVFRARHQLKQALEAEGGNVHAE